MDHDHPYPQQTRPFQSSAQGTDSSNIYPYHPPDSISNGSLNHFHLPRNGNPPTIPPPGFEQLRQMGMAMGMPPLPADLNSVINHLQSAQENASLPTFPITPAVSVLSQQDPHLSRAQVQLPGLSSISPPQKHERFPFGQSSGSNVAQNYSEVKIESPNSSSNAQFSFKDDVGNPLLPSQSFSSRNPQPSSLAKMTRRDKSNKYLKEQAVKALRDLVDAGVQLDAVLSDRELVEYSDVIRALYQEATGESFIASGGSLGRRTDVPVPELRDNVSAGANTGQQASISSWALGSMDTPTTKPEQPLSFQTGLGSSKLPLNTPQLAQKSGNVPASAPLKKPASNASKPSQSREEYLAKLAAAKSKRAKRSSSSKDKATINSEISKPDEPQTESTVSLKDDSSAKPATYEPQSSFDTIETSPSTFEVPKKSSIKTDLVKQRLEELKRSTAAKQSLALQEVASKSSSRPSTPIAKSTAEEFDVPSFGRSFSDDLSIENMPINATMTQPPLSQTPVISLGVAGNHTTTNGGRKRPIAADFMAENAPPKRMLIRKHFSPETCVIDVSDTEESEDEMDLDDTNSTPRASMRVSGISPRSVSNPQFPSGISGYSPRRAVSGVQTPDSKTAERLKNIEAQKRELQARIEAMQQKKGRLSKGEMQAPASPSLNRSFSSPSPKVTFDETSSFGTSDDIRKQKMLKKSELESQIAANMAKMEELRMQRLQLEEDRNKLATELEAAGVDTEGMTMSEMIETQEKLLEASQEQNRELDSFVEPEESTSSTASDLETHQAAFSEVKDPMAMFEPVPSATDIITESDVTASDSMDLDGLQQQEVASVETPKPGKPSSLHSPEAGEIEDEEDLSESGEISSSSTSALAGIVSEMPPTVLPIPNETSQLSNDTNMLLHNQSGSHNFTSSKPSESKPLQESLTHETATPDSIYTIENPTVIPVEQEGEAKSVEDSSEEMEDDEMDMESSSNELTDDDEGYEPELTIHHDPTPISIVDDVPELRHYREQQEEMPLTMTIGSNNKFTPYESALKQFKAYRYHPQYLQTVSQGYNSLTYSNKIDPFKPLCQFELAGGTCNDPDCQFQHFRDLGLNGTELLMQLGFNGMNAYKGDYQVGLKEHINKVASQTGLNAESLASSIVEYRRQFFGDSSKVLDLGVNDSEL